MNVELIAAKDYLFTKIALFENGKLVEYFIEPNHLCGIVGNIYLGKVNKVLPGVDCAFIDIGLEKDGFLYKGDMIPFCNGEREHNPHPLKSLNVGDKIVVQVTKESIGQKGPRLTTCISLPGNYLVFSPYSSRIGVSKKVSDSERERLKSMLSALKGDFEGGFIARTAAESASSDELSSEMQSLVEQWSLISLKIKKGDAPTLLHQELSLPLKAVREILVKSKGKLITDDEKLAEEISSSLNGIKEKEIKITLWKNEKDILEEYNVESELEEALKPRVWLSSGGCIVIQPTEALVAIDVNSGRFVGKKSLEETAFKINLEAAEEIVRQLRLRNLGGIIVIDFIDMIEKSHREQLIQRLQELLKADFAKTRILKISEFGLVEMTRKRTSKPLDKIYYTTCPCCEGKGKIKAPWRVLNGILKQLQNTSKEKKYLVKVSSYVKKFIDENWSMFDLPQNIIIEEDRIKDPSKFEIKRLPSNPEKNI
jgi:ribonuclease G